MLPAATDDARVTSTVAGRCDRRDPFAQSESRRWRRFTRSCSRIRQPALRPSPGPTPRLRRSYSVREARRTGSSRPARWAGTTPKTMPTAAETPNASASDHQVIAAGTGDSAADQQRGADAQRHAERRRRAW